MSTVEPHAQLLVSIQELHPHALCPALSLVSVTPDTSFMEQNAFQVTSVDVGMMMISTILLAMNSGQMTLAL